MFVSKSKYEAQQRQYKCLEEQNKFFMAGLKAMDTCLEYNGTIIAILEQVGLQEIEVPKVDCLKNIGKTLAVNINPINEAIKIKIVTDKDLYAKQKVGDE